MKRSQFISNLLALGGLNLLPANVFKCYKKYYLLQFFVAGFRFYKGMELLESMNEGDLLELVREHENEHDECAIALYWNNEKIGFIPREENMILSRLIDANALGLIAEITHLNKEVQPWENVHVAVSFLKEADTTDEEKTKYMTVLDTPRYRSFKAGQDKVIRVAIDDGYKETTDWYKYLVENSKDDGIYDIIHSSDLKPDYEYGRDTGDFIVVNKKRLPPDESVQEIVKKAEEIMGELNDVFGEDGYIVMSVQEAESLVAKAEAVANVTDKFGQHYIELLMS
jgi:hypothetical protein